MAETIVHDPTARGSLPPSFAPAPQSEVLVLSDLWSPAADVLRTIAQLSANGAHGHVVQIVDPAEETFPFSGRIEFVDPEDGHSITVGRAEAWREEYQARVDLHRAQIRAETDRLGWSFIVHRTDRTASELLLALHTRMTAAASSTSGCTKPSGRPAIMRPSRTAAARASGSRRCRLGRCPSVHAAAAAIRSPAGRCGEC